MRTYIHGFTDDNNEKNVIRYAGIHLFAQGYCMHQYVELRRKHPTEIRHFELCGEAILRYARQAEPVQITLRGRLVPPTPLELRQAANRVATDLAACGPNANLRHIQSQAYATVCLLMWAQELETGAGRAATRRRAR